ncbi:MAG: hypothetical protein IH987_13590, partial [Planctomycetes bacterium]|nr:hypothetical protein [Planctomycetota bacterium]
TDGDATERWDPIAAARRAFLDDATARRLAATNGPFAAAIWDGDRRRLELITDRHGMYPIYVASYRSAFLFSGQIKGIWAVGVVPTDVDPLAICLMLSTGELVSDITLFRNIRLLSAGSRTTVSASGMESENYWGYEFQERDDLDFSAAAQQLGGLLRRGVERICRHSSSVGVPLSGGLDSRVLLAATPDPADVPSFTWGVEGCRDLRYASAAADAVGSPHQSFVFDGGYLKRLAAFGVWLTEGQLPAVDFHVLPYVVEVARKCDVILNGYAGDAILGGNFIKKNWWCATTREKAAAALWQWRDIQCPADFRHRILGKAMEGCDFTDARKAFEGALMAMPGETPMGAAQAFLLAHRVRRRTSCGTALMRWRVESDHPFFDNDFFDFAGSLPYGWRYRHRLYLEVMRRCFAEVAGVRWQRTGLPAGAPYALMFCALALHKLDRIRVTKRFFKGRQVSDFGGWMRGPLRGYITDLLTDARTLDRGWFVADTVRAALNDHLEARADHSSFIGSMISL